MTNALSSVTVLKTIVSFHAKQPPNLLADAC